VAGADAILPDEIKRCLSTFFHNFSNIAVSVKRNNETIDAGFKGQIPFLLPSQSTLVNVFCQLLVIILSIAVLLMCIIVF